MIKETWKPIYGYEGLYEVSNLGRVKSLNYNHTGEEKIMKPKIEQNGYLRVGLYKNKKHRLFSLHRLVGQAFIPNPMPLFFDQINHKNEDKTDNRVENLEWCDASYNNNYGTHIERFSKTNRNGKLSKPVLQFTLEGNFVREWPSTKEVERQMGYCHTTINECCKGIYKTSHNYIWKYK